MKLLLADQDIEGLDVTTYALRRYGFEVTAVQDGLQALRCWKETLPDLVLAEFDLPGLTGLELCREIRQQAATPVIIVSARNADDEVVRSFEVGADDYVLKPFSHRQLAMRIRAILNRALGVSGAVVQEATLRLGSLCLDVESHEVTHGSQTVRLTPIEFRIFYLLLLNAGRVVSSGRLIDYVWGYQGADPAMLKMHISRIRQKLALHAPNSLRLDSVRWVGYLLTSPEVQRDRPSLRRQRALTSDHPAGS
jgi:DNA-binding response OmpR family regulator